MKYIKTYEKIKPKYSEGDIIKVKFKGWAVDKRENIEWLTILEIKKIHITGPNFTYGCFQFDGAEEDNTIYVKEKNIIGTISKEEARMLFDVGKYNL